MTLSSSRERIWASVEPQTHVVMHRAANACCHGAANTCCQALTVDARRRSARTQLVYCSALRVLLVQAFQCIDRLADWFSSLRRGKAVSFINIAGDRWRYICCPLAAVHLRARSWWRRFLVADVAERDGAQQEPFHCAALGTTGSIRSCHSPLPLPKYLPPLLLAAEKCALELHPVRSLQIISASSGRVLVVRSLQSSYISRTCLLFS